MSLAYLLIIIPLGRTSVPTWSRVILAGFFLFFISSLTAVNGQGRELWTYRSSTDPAWDGELTWTTVSQGEDISAQKVVPQEGDILHITNNITVYLTENIDLAELTIIFHNGGLDLGIFHLNGIEEIRQDPEGTGLLRIGSTGYYPSAGLDNFSALPGTTVEYYNFSGTLVGPAVYNNLLLSKTDGGNHNIILGSDLTVINSLTLRNIPGSGNLTFTLGASSTPVSLSTRDLTVGSATSLVTGEFNAVHNITVRGNFVNNGITRLTNQSESDRYGESTNGAATLTFTGAADSHFSGSGSILRLYRLIIDKGSDRTFILDANPANMQLWYRTDLADEGAGQDPVIRKPLWIRSGTLRLGSNVHVEKLVDHGPGPSGSNFLVPRNASLWIDGATVNITSSSGNADNTALSVAGELRITAGTLNTGKSAGILYRETAVIRIDGGTSTVSQLHYEGSADNQASFEITGGILNVNGSGLTNDGFSRFSLPLGVQNLRMSGGTINLSNATSTGILAFGLNPENHSVTGGTININITGTGNIISTVPLFNLNLQSGSLVVQDIEGIGVQPMMINNNLTLGSSTVFNTNGLDLWIGGNFTLESESSYVHGTNTTRFFRSGPANNAGSTVTNNSGTTPLSFHSISLEKTDIHGSYNQSKTVFLPPSGSPAVISAEIKGNLSFNSPYQTLNLNNSRIRIHGNLMVNQLSRIVNDPGNGILLNPEPIAPQTIKTSRLTSANNFVLDNGAGATLTENSLMESLQLVNGTLNLGSRNLTINNPLTGNRENYSAGMMIMTNGSAADGGLTYNLDGRGAGSSVVYPVGVSGKYTPFTLTLGGSGTFGHQQNFLGVTPVNSVHPSVDAGSENNAVKYYWKVTTGFQDPLPAGLTAAYRFDFLYDDRASGQGGNLRGVAILNDGSVYRDGTYSVGNPTPCYVGFSLNFATGDFTGGTQNIFNPGQVGRTFHSIASGNWNASGTWTRVTGNQGSYPQAGDAALINPDHAVLMNITDARAAELEVNGTLDLAGTTGHVFDVLLGDGRIRTRNALPVTGDDLAAFTEAGNSTIEYYGTGTAITVIPATYYNLEITGTNIELPDADLHVLNNLLISGGAATLNAGAGGNIDIDNELLLQNGATLTIPATSNSRSITAGNIIIDNSALHATAGTGAVHNINIEGGGITLNGTSTASLFTSGNSVNMTLSGPGNTTISGTNGNNISLNRLIINKQSLSDRVSVTANLMLNGPANGTSSEKPLGMQTGTLILERTAGTPTDITLTSGGGNFILPSTTALIVRGGNPADPGNRNTLRAGGSHISLDGLLALEGAASLLLNEGGSSTDIIYTTTGNAEIRIGGDAVLELGGQLRRPLLAASAILKYTQTGGRVTVGTEDAATPSRGVFEILNSGSSFTHTEGLLAINRSSGNPEGDIILEPGSFNLSQGSILATGVPGQTIGINSSMPLSNIEVAAGTLRPVIRRLSLAGHLTIDDGAFYASNNLSLTLGGNFINNGTFTSSGTDTTIFTGITQSISGHGKITFNHLVSRPSVSLSVDTDIEIKGNLAIRSGVMDDKGNVIDVMGNIDNISAHAGTGQIRLSGPSRQDIGGGGTFSNLTIGNPSGARLVTNITVDGNLALDDGLLNIRNYRLTLLQNGTISGFTEDGTRMIQSNGNIGDAGVYKTFPSGATGNFIIPIGIPGKYLPLSINFNPFQGGTIGVAPVNVIHSTIQASGDQSRVLPYYWEVSADGISQATGNLVFDFDPDDVADVSDYYAAQLSSIDNSWTKSAMSQDDRNNSKITFNFTSAGDDRLKGAFTAGEESAIPDVVRVYSTTGSGNWDDAGIWDTGLVPPQGVIVLIHEGHNVLVTTNRKRVYRTRINGRLWIDPATTAHNFGLVEGTGTLAVETGNLPAGRWSEIFMGCGGGTVEFGGSTSYILDHNYHAYRHLVITGSGIKTLPNSPVTLCGNLRIEGSGGNVTLKAAEARNLTVSGNIHLAATGSLDLAPSMEVRLEGSIEKADGAGFNTAYSLQRFIIGGSSPKSLAGNFSGSSGFHNLTVNSSADVTVNGPLTVRNFLNLDNGRVITSVPNPLTVGKTDGMGLESVTGGHVSGPYSAIMGATTANKFLPTGSVSHRKFIHLPDLPQVPAMFGAEYFAGSPSTAGMGHINFSSPLQSVSQSEYWRIEGPSGHSSRITLTLNGTSDIAAALSQSGEPGNLRIAVWNGTQWEIAGDDVTISGTLSNGTVTTTMPVTFSGVPQYFTLAATGEIDIPTASIVSGDATYCAPGGNYQLEVTLTGSRNWRLVYSVNDVAQEEITISNNESPKTIPLPVTETSAVVLVSVGYEDGTEGIIYGGSVTATVVSAPPAPLNITGGGNICGSGFATIILEGSDAGFTYRLKREAEIIMELEGTGGDLAFTPIYNAGTYIIEGYATGHPGCAVFLGDAKVAIAQPSTVEFTGGPEAPECEGVEITLTLSVHATGDFTIKIRETLENDSGYSRVYEIAGNSDDPEEFVLSHNLVPGNGDPIDWHGIERLETPGLALFRYSIVSFTDDSQCQGVIHGEGISASIFKIPETGPQYHIPNTFGQ